MVYSGVVSNFNLWVPKTFMGSVEPTKQRHERNKVHNFLRIYGFENPLLKSYGFRRTHANDATVPKRGMSSLGYPLFSAIFDLPTYPKGGYPFWMPPNYIS